jgi:hypothetical protein
MAASRLHTLTRLFLAVLYGVVGFTGESLHYLLTDPALFSSSAQPASSSYYHTHGPDYHGHFHRHAHDESRHGSQSADRTSLTADESTHHPHACPLLTLVSTLKLSHADYRAVSIVLERQIAPCFECVVVGASEIALNSYPRGPPTQRFA